MQLHVIDTGFFKLDGGAMFGVVPKSLWQRTNPADANNLCTWAMRCLLIEDGNRLILIDTGIGDKQDQKFLAHYELHGEETLLSSLRKKGFAPEDITDVFLTHLHFDHCGGALAYTSDRSRIVPRFSKARYWSNREHWKWATEPNPREKASFLKENILPLQESGQLAWVEEGGSAAALPLDILYVSGHTDKMMLPKISYKGHTIVYMADLIPSASHIPLPYVMGYDTRPLITMEEKAAFLDEAAREKHILFFEHDPLNECCTVQQTEKGVRLEKAFRLAEI